MYITTQTDRRPAHHLVDAFFTDVTLGVEKTAFVSTRLTFI